MPFYSALRRQPDGVRTRAIDGLIAIRAALHEAVPTRTRAEKLLLATWNIREFDSAKYGARCEESLYYIAEIIDHFDIVAIQEVRADLTALQRVRSILGSWWDCIFSDVTYGRSGNDERMALLYDRRKVRPTGLAGEVVLPDVQGQSPRQIARTPFICGFKCGWIDFDLCTVHTYYGNSVPNEPRRLEEIRALAKLLASRTDAGSSQNIVLLGDFNIFKRTDETFAALTDAGFVVPTKIMKLPGSNVAQDKEYDQIAFLERKKRFTIENAGVFNFYKTLMRNEDEALWADVMGADYDAKSVTERRKYYRDWRTYQLSDHFPLWVELQIDHSDAYLASLRP